MVPSETNFVPLDEALAKVQPGWLAQFRGNGFISDRIRQAGRGVHSHTAMVARWNGDVMLLELREGRGGRKRSLPWHAQAYPKTPIDFYAPNLTKYPELKIPESVAYMRQLADKEYGYSNLFYAAMMHLPLVQWAFGIFDRATFYRLDVSRVIRADVDDLSEVDSPPYCSHAFTTAYRVGGGVDPVPHLADHLVEPSDLTRSLLFHDPTGEHGYQFSICRDKE